MELESIINKESLTEVKKYFIGPRVRWTMMIASVLLFVIAMLDILFAKEFNYLFVFIIVEIIILIELNYLKNKCVRLNIERLRESYNTDSLTLKFNMNEDDIVLHNPISKGSSHMKYTTFNNYYETENYCLLKSKSSQLIIINKSSITEKDYNKMIKILKDKAINLKFHI